MSGPGDKAKLVDLFDTALAVETGLEAIFKIEVTFSKSPKKGVKCGSISVFKNNSIDLAVNPLLVDKDHLQKVESELGKQTEVMYQDPIYFREDQGQWMDWAMAKALKISDRLGGANIIVKAPKLKIREIRSYSEVASGRGDMSTLFKSLKDINHLLDGDFKWDPWSKTVRRGHVNAKMGKR